MWSRLGAPHRTMWSKPESFFLIFCIWCILMTVWTAYIHFTISKHEREPQDLHFGGFRIWPYSTRSSCLVSYSSSFVRELSDHWLRLSRLCKKTVIIFCCVLFVPLPHWFVVSNFQNSLKCTRPGGSTSGSFRFMWRCTRRQSRSVKTL